MKGKGGPGSRVRIKGGRIGPTQRRRERDGRETLELRGNVEIRWAYELQIGSAPGSGPTRESMV